MTGNQHRSTRASLLGLLRLARAALRVGVVDTARECLAAYHCGHDQAPASTRRRWKCGR